ncbi:MAG: hypothetical protein K8S56_00155 [Candidatus Cloacimonetes bacterium]|nr:hypothetical protein [Candidatus Cloacimonadota bacterium]
MAKKQSKQSDKQTNSIKCWKCSTVLGSEFFCPHCGTETDFIEHNLSARQEITSDWKRFRKIDKSFRFSVFFILVILLPLGVVAWFTRSNYWLNNMALLVLTPFALVPFSLPNDTFSISAYVKSLRYYPSYLGFVAISIVYFFVLKVVCTGEPLYSLVYDPILHLVRLVMVLYWIAVILPAPVLIAKYGVNPWQAIMIAYKAGKNTRWQQFFLAVILTCANVVGLLTLGYGLLYSLPFSFYSISGYVQRMVECGLLEEVDSN